MRAWPQALTALETRTEREEQPHAFGAGAGHLDAHDRCDRRVEPYTDAVRPLETVQVEVSPARYDLAGIEEECHIDELPRHPAVLSGEQHAIAVAEAPRRIASEQAASTKSRHQEVRHRAAGVRVGGRRDAPQRNHPVLP